MIPRKRIHIILLGVYFFIFTSFISLNAQWARTYGGSDHDHAYSILQTSDGGYVVVGNISSEDPSGPEGIWIIKLDSNGDIEWQRNYEGSGSNSVRSIQQTSDGGYIVAGAASFRMYDELYNSFWIMKITAAGDVVWEYVYGRMENDAAISIQQTIDGGYIVAGLGDSYLDWHRYKILKLDANGGVEWQRIYGKEGMDTAYAVQQTIDGGYIVVGNIRSDDPSGPKDIWILKLNSEGNSEWQKTYGGDSADSAYSIQQTDDGGYIVAGYTNSFGAGGGDVWILKLSSYGTIEWQKTYGESNTRENANSIHKTSDGGYIVAGTTLSFDTGWSEILILKLDSVGEIEWQRTFGTENMNYYAYSVQQTNDAGYIVAGYTESFSAGTQDFLVLKISSTGDIDPSCEFIGSSNAIVLDANSASQETSVNPGIGSMTPYTTQIQLQDFDGTVTAICGDPPKSTPSVNSGEEKGPCFIATAAYGSPQHPYLDILRDFRDKYLMSNKLGRSLVGLYYKYSPFFAGIIAKHEALKAVGRINLLPLVVFSYSMVHFDPIVTGIMIILVFLLPISFVPLYRRRMRKIG